MQFAGSLLRGMKFIHYVKKCEKVVRFNSPVPAATAAVCGYASLLSAIGLFCFWFYNSESHGEWIECIEFFSSTLAMPIWRVSSQFMCEIMIPNVQNPFYIMNFNFLFLFLQMPTTTRRTSQTQSRKCYPIEDDSSEITNLRVSINIRFRIVDILRVIESMNFDVMIWFDAIYQVRNLKSLIFSFFLPWKGVDQLTNHENREVLRKLRKQISTLLSCRYGDIIRLMIS